jgi:hypothetical protein
MWRHDAGPQTVRSAKALLSAGGHLLVLGGPGSGKTTIALVKGATEIANGALAPGQKVLFLSFARATVARIVQESKVRVPADARSWIEIGTYHGFGEAHGHGAHQDRAPVGSGLERTDHRAGVLKTRPNLPRRPRSRCQPPSGRFQNWCGGQRRRILTVGHFGVADHDKEGEESPV